MIRRDQDDGAVHDADGQDRGHEDLPPLADRVEHRDAGIATEQPDDDELVVQVRLEPEEQAPPGDQQQRHAHVEQQHAQHADGARREEVADDAGASLRQQHGEGLHPQPQQHRQRDEDHVVGGEFKVAAELPDVEGDDQEDDEDEGDVARQPHVMAHLDLAPVGQEDVDLFGGDAPWQPRGHPPAPVPSGTVSTGRALDTPRRNGA
jgi:hypothetical protein